MHREPTEVMRLGVKIDIFKPAFRNRVDLMGNGNMVKFLNASIPPIPALTMAFTGICPFMEAGGT